MSESAKAPRFPYVAAALCAACVGAGVWTWMRYSYCWRIAPDDLCEVEPSKEPRAVGRYACVQGVAVGCSQMQGGNTFYALANAKTLEGRLPIAVAGEAPRSIVYTCEPVTFVGRVKPWIAVYGLLHAQEPAATGQFLASLRRPSTLRDDRLLALVGELPRLRNPVFLDTTASRFHGASIAGLVVGAMGVFVFAVALRHWLGERRRVAGEAEAT